MPRRRVRGHEQAPGRAGGAPLRQPAQLGRRRAAPEGPGGHRAAAAALLGLPGRRGRGARRRKSQLAGGHADRTLAQLAKAGFPVSPDARQVDGHDGGGGPLRGAGRGAPRPRLRDRRRGHQGRRPGAARTCSAPPRGRPAGPSPSSSRPRSARPGCSTSWSRSGAPAGPRRSPASSPSSSAARPSAWRRCTTRTRWRPRTSVPGDLVIVRKAGDVIPEVVGPVRAGPRCAEAAQAEVEVPDVVPVLRRSRWCACRARATPTAPTSTARRSGCSASSHYASRSAMDIEGLGEERVVQLVGGRADQRRGRPLRPDGRSSWSTLERFGALSAANLVAGIEASKAQPLSRLLVALGIRHVGPDGRPGGGPRLRDRSRPSRRPRVEELAAVDGVGGVIAASVAEFLAADTNEAVIERLRAAGVTHGGAGGRRDDGAAEPGRRAPCPQTLAGKTVVVTGAVPGLHPGGGRGGDHGAGRQVARAACRRRPSCSSWATSPGASKLKKAEELGIPTARRGGVRGPARDRRAARREPDRCR